MKYWELDDEIKEKYGAILFKYIEKCGGLDKVSIDDFILLPKYNSDEYYWTFDLYW